MTYIHELPEWPQLTWSADALVQGLAAMRYKQGHYLGRMGTLGFELRSEANLAALTNEIVRSSAIEGERLNADEVRSSIAKRLGLHIGGLPPSSRAVDGMVEMMLDATRHNDRSLTAERLFGWHAALFPTGHSGMYRITAGTWREPAAGPMRVVSGAMGRERVHFQAPEAERVAEEMSRFLDWFNGNVELDPVLKAAVAHFWFVTIHPFEDGNGRIARAIADMTLAHGDGMSERFYSLSVRIEAERKDYYFQLESAQRGSTDITAWIAWFIGCLERAIDSADDMLVSVLKKARFWQSLNIQPVNERQRLVLNRMLADWQGHLTTAKYAGLTKCSADTAQRDMKDLVERGALIQNDAGGRSTSYRLPDQL